MNLIDQIISETKYEGDKLEITLSGIKYRLKWIDGKYVRIIESTKEYLKK